MDWFSVRFQILKHFKEFQIVSCLNRGFAFLLNRTCLQVVAENSNTTLNPNNGLFVTWVDMTYQIQDRYLLSIHSWDSVVFDVCLFYVPSRQVEQPSTHSSSCTFFSIYCYIIVIIIKLCNCYLIIVIMAAINKMIPLYQLYCIISI